MCDAARARRNDDLVQPQIADADVCHNAAAAKTPHEAALEALGVERRNLPTIGYDVQLIDALAEKIHASLSFDYEHTDLHETRRGRYFEVKLADSRIARVTVELDRVDPDA